MFGLDPKALNEGMAQVAKMAADQKRMADAVEQLNKLLPELIAELKTLNKSKHVQNSDSDLRRD